MGTAESLSLQASDTSGQKVADVSNVPFGARISDVIDDLVPEMGLPMTDAKGRPLTYHAILVREGRQLFGQELVRESLEDADSIVLSPNVDAGGGCG